MKEASATILEFPEEEPSKEYPKGGDIFVVIEVDTFEDGRRLGRIEGVFSSEVWAREHVESRDTRHAISYEIEKHTLDWHRFNE